MPIGSVPFTDSFRDISVETLSKFEAFTHKDFEDKIVFPIRDILGEIIVFIGRHMHSNVNPKYMITPPKVSPPLFPSKPKMLQGSIILVEGIFDMLNLQDKGLANAVCAFGTQTLLNSWEEKLDPFKLQGLNKVYILFDGDLAGKTAADKLEKEIGAEYLTEVIYLPDGVDPGDLSEEDVLALKELVYKKNNS
jgi:DNA primase